MFAMSTGQGTTASPSAASRRLSPKATLDRLPGIGPATAQRLAFAGLRTVRDLVMWFPRRYRELCELESPDHDHVGEFVRLAGTVHHVSSAWLPGRRSMVTVTFASEDGSLLATRFFNQPWLKKNYTIGQRRIIEGRLARKKSRWLVEAAKVLPIDAAVEGPVQLRYPEVDGVSLPRLQKWIARCLDELDWVELTFPALPAGLDDFEGDAHELLLAMHRPESVDDHERARRVFALREAVELFEAVERARRARATRPARTFAVDDELAARIGARIPLELTSDQDHAVRSAWQRLAGPSAMGVLLQGDVGTGKTAVAVATALAVLARGGRVAFLAPTELLAEQHFNTVSRWLEGSGVRTALLTASTRKNVGDELRTQFEQPGAVFVFGTHALFSQDVALPGLGLVIVDEQHRFGVNQRMALVHKGDNPHVLVMTATPIPRTLALSLFGDLDVVSLRAKPPGHRTVPAHWLATEKWSRALQSIARSVRRGGRVFVVCPVVGEEREKGGAVLLHETLSERFRCGLVHGRMKPAERQEVLAAFRDGELDVLVGTTVLEVGVDVPAATLMVVVKAERFGIATLHQLRGRVGRGRRRGLCLLCGGGSERVAAVCRTTDGFELAEQDLALRGSGELLGTAQSGFVDLRALDPGQDLELLLRVRQAVRQDAGQ